MPSRMMIVAIVLFWFAVIGLVVCREVMPFFATDAPPAVMIDFSDEATHRFPAQWGVYHGSKRLGTLGTQMTHDRATENYIYTSTYNQLEFTTRSITISAPKLTLTTTVTRDGAMVKQTVKGAVAVGGAFLGPLKLHATLATEGIVSGGVMSGRTTVKSDWLNLDEPLEPVPVPAGQVLQPLQPMNRLRGVQPGRQWVIHEVNPLGDAVARMVRKMAKDQGAGSLFPAAAVRPEIVATVRSKPVDFAFRNSLIACWVIDYRKDQATASTWVVVADGKVLRQEARLFDEVLRLERED